jgi:hypothetical protein
VARFFFEPFKGLSGLNLVFSGWGFMVVKYFNGLVKKAMSLDKDYLVVLLLFILVLFSAEAYASVSAPEQVIVSDETTFFVEIMNESDEEVDLEVSFFAPLKSEIIAPNRIAPNGKTNVKITIFNSKYNENTKLDATIEVKLDEKVEQKNIVLAFEKNNSNSVLVGLFSFSFFTQQMTNFSFLQWVIFWILVIVAAVLLIAFISRVRNRV